MDVVSEQPKYDRRSSAHVGALGSPPSKKRRSANVGQIEQKTSSFNSETAVAKPSRASARKQNQQTRRSLPKQEVRSSSPSPPPPVRAANAQKAGSKDKATGEEWATEDLAKLVETLLSMMPKTDTVKYSTSSEKIDWSKVHVASYSPEECKDKWNTVMTKLRRFRTLTELLRDAQEWVKHPWMTYNNSKGKPRHPDLPKKPLTPYFRYFLEKREKFSKEHPEMSMTELAKLLAKKFQELPEKKKQRYKESYERDNAEYKEAMEKFRTEHPEAFPELETKSKAKSNGPQKPQTPAQLFLLDKMTKHMEPGMNKKELEEKYKAQWKNLPDSKRVRYIKKAMADGERYAADLAEYCIVHPDFKPDNMKSAISKAEKEMKDRSDGKPERPPNSGYSLYSKIMLKELKEIPSKEKMTEISRRWKELSEEERQSYTQQAADALERYQDEFKMYLANLPEEERKKIEEEGGSFLKKKRKAPASGTAASRKAAKIAVVEPVDTTPTKPKKPMSALFFYQQEKLAQYRAKNPEKSEQELTRLIAREYGELSEKKKDKYKKMAEEAKKSNVPVPAKNGVVKKKVFKGEPKKPPQSGYSLYTSELLPKLVGFEPKSRMSEISKRWAVMPDSDKDKYRKKATELARKYNKELNKFLLTLSKEDQQLYQELKATKNVRKKKSPKVEAVKEERLSSSEESGNEEVKEESGSGESGSGSESESGSDSGSGSGESGSDSDSDSDAESNSDDSDSGNDNDSDNDNNAKAVKAEDDDDKESGDGSTDDSDSQNESGSASESDSDEEE